jgi:putative effector of murein hydrolase LrgA (UPF0299 family)
MNRNADDSQRTAGDFILFGILFVGFVLAAAGLVTSSVPGCVTGVLLMALGLAGFMLKGKVPGF